MATLTKRQKQMVDYLENYIEQHGYAPTLAEVGEYFGLSSLATVHKHLRNKKLIILGDGMQPAYISTVEGYDADLRRAPLLHKADFLSGSIQMQFVNDPFHFAEIETLAVLEVVVKSWTQFNRHWSILQH